MKVLKKVAVGFVLVAGLGLNFASCSDDIYYEEPVIPILPAPEQPPIIDPR